MSALKQMTLRHLSPDRWWKSPCVYFSITPEYTGEGSGGIVPYTLNLSPDVSDQLQVPAALSPGKETPVPIG